jgi:hypothetical protein
MQRTSMRHATLRPLPMHLAGASTNQRMHGRKSRVQTSTCVAVTRLTWLQPRTRSSSIRHSTHALTGSAKAT